MMHGSMLAHGRGSASLPPNFKPAVCAIERDRIKAGLPSLSDSQPDQLLSDLRKANDIHAGCLHVENPKVRRSDSKKDARTLVTATKKFVKAVGALDPAMKAIFAAKLAHARRVRPLPIPRPGAPHPFFLLPKELEAWSEAAAATLAALGSKATLDAEIATLPRGPEKSIPLSGRDRNFAIREWLKVIADVYQHWTGQPIKPHAAGKTYKGQGTDFLYAAAKTIKQSRSDATLGKLLAEELRDPSPDELRSTP